MPTALHLGAKSDRQIVERRVARPRWANRRAVWVAAVLMALALVYWCRRPLGPDQIAYLTARAIRTGDAKLLVRLTSPAECARLGLSEDSVRAYLRGSIWSRGVPATVTIERLDGSVPDEARYRARVRQRAGEPERWPTYILVTDSQTEGWHLALGQTLYHMAAMECADHDPDTELRAYVDLAQRSGIRGRRTNSGGYRMLDEDRRALGLMDGR